MLSRGKYRSSSIKNRAAMDVLEERLRSIATREASVRAEAYEMLEIVTNVIGELEDAGDDLVTEFKAYQEGKKTFQGGGIYWAFNQSSDSIHYTMDSLQGGTSKVD